MRGDRRGCGEPRLHGHQPVNDGHCLIVPKAHFASLFEMPPGLFGEVAAAAAKVAGAIEAELRPGGISLVQANGPLAGQSVFPCTSICCRGAPAMICRSTGTATAGKAAGAGAASPRSPRACARFSAPAVDPAALVKVRSGRHENVAAIARTQVTMQRDIRTIQRDLGELKDRITVLTVAVEECPSAHV
jgi:HIT domain